MIFKEPGKRFELALVGYRFPELAEDEHDSNWLNVTIRVVLPEGSFSATAPCLLTREAGSIARWLENIGGGTPHSIEMDAIEPMIEFRHVRTAGESEVLRIRLQDSMLPPWTKDQREFDLELAVPRAQLTDAAASLQAQLQAFPPRGNAAAKPPFTPRALSPHFFVDWLLTVPGATEQEALTTTQTYMQWLDLEPVVQSSQPYPGTPGRWYVRLGTELAVPVSEPFRALFEMLSSLPMPYGPPRVTRPLLFPDGAFSFSGQLDPTEEDPEQRFSLVRGHFTLTNFQDEERYRRVVEGWARG
jgi:hypothetical protein